jgi:GTP-binding protein
MYHSFKGYQEMKPLPAKKRKGALIATQQGLCTAYALAMLEDRGIMFVKPQTEVYSGMVVGENNRELDLEVNPVKAKAFSNVRTHAHDENIRLTPARIMTVEEAMSFIEPDEMIEVTPKSIRLRKKLLDPSKRKQASRAAEQSS